MDLLRHCVCNRAAVSIICIQKAVQRQIDVELFRIKFFDGIKMYFDYFLGRQQIRICHISEKTAGYLIVQVFTADERPGVVFLL